MTIIAVWFNHRDCQYFMMSLFISSSYSETNIVTVIGIVLLLVFSHYIYIYIYKFIHIHLHTYVYVYVYVFVYMYIYIYTHMLNLLVEILRRLIDLAPAIRSRLLPSTSQRRERTWQRRGRCFFSPKIWQTPDI